MRIAVAAAAAAALVLVPVAAAAAAPSSPSPAPPHSLHIPGGGGTPNAGRVPGQPISKSQAASSTPTPTPPPPPPTLAPPAGYPVYGIDVSSAQPNVDWANFAQQGASFAYVKATEGTTYTNPIYATQYTGALQAGMYVGSYAFARPDANDPVAQADYLVGQSQPMTAGKTLPYMLDLEWPYKGSGVSDSCWGLTPTQMVSWIRQFVDEIRYKTGMPTLIYTNTYWWNPCTASNTTFGDQLLDIANWTPQPSPLPAGWTSWTFWQYSDTGGKLDQDAFFGSLAQLANFTYPTLVAPVPKFSDVPVSSPFYDDIIWLAQSNITLGYSDGTFRPTQLVTRGQMAAFLYRAAHHGVSAPACTAAPFPDVQPGNLFCGAIAWLQTSGIAGGYSDGNFHPERTIARQEMSAFLFREANPGVTEPACDNPFPDVTATNEFCGYISWLKSSGITTGYGDGNFHPTWFIARQEMARYLHLMADLQPTPSS